MSSILPLYNVWRNPRNILLCELTQPRAQISNGLMNEHRLYDGNDSMAAKMDRVQVVGK